MVALFKFLMLLVWLNHRYSLCLCKKWITRKQNRIINTKGLRHGNSQRKRIDLLWMHTNRFPCESKVVHMTISDALPRLKKHIFLQI
ncbi:hypothetical protein HanIR_Chr16g0832611 [Helianthus annuus]|nr:hypothetical protein HanIR_Chr16g0832611 [Helianthus annuus]